MGKSKRIRAERAQAIAANPDKYVKQNSSKKATIVTIVIVAVIAAMVLGLVAVAIAQSLGTFVRFQTAYSYNKDGINISINGTMLSYLYYQQYNYLYNLYAQYFDSQSLQNYLSSIATSATTSAKSQAEQTIKLCVAATANGIKLDDDDYAEINETIKSIEDSAKSAGVSINEAYGNLGINIDDIRAMLELSTLASKYRDIKNEEFTNAVKDNDEELKKYMSEHMSLFYKADYLVYTSDDKAVVDKFKNFTTAEEFKTELLQITMDKKFKTKFSSATSSLEAKDLPVVSLKDAIKDSILAELKYSLLDIEIDGLKFEDDSTEKERIKLIFEKLYGDTTFEAGKTDNSKSTATTISDALYTAIATVVKDMTTEATKTIGNSEKIGKEYALPDLADEEDETEEEDEEDKPTESEIWVFDNARKAGDLKIFTIDPEDSSDTTSYSVYLVTKPNYVDTEITKNVGHILIGVEQKTASSEATQEEKDKIAAENDKAYADKKVEAEKLLAEVAGLSKDKFEEIALKNTEDSNVFYENVHTEEMVEEFEEWLFDENRTVGETGLVKTEYGWHIMYFVGDGYEAWKADAITYQSGDAYTDWFEALPYEINVNDKAIANILG
ncbi:MAG: hypothetical protein E7640_00175 [Ruminococcaceae bacterium]|nr:hypothetical protein [Oscillospiraceae bacterium]